MDKVGRSSKGSVPGRVSLVTRKALSNPTTSTFDLQSARGASLSSRLYTLKLVPREDEPNLVRPNYAQILPTPHEKSTAPKHQATTTRIPNQTQFPVRSDGPIGRDQSFHSPRGAIVFQIKPQFPLDSVCQPFILNINI